MSTLYQQAKARVETSEALAPHAEFILADWDEGEEHLQWVLDATEAEILDWVEQ